MQQTPGPSNSLRLGLQFGLTMTYAIWTHSPHLWQGVEFRVSDQRLRDPVVHGRTAGLYLLGCSCCSGTFHKSNNNTNDISNLYGLGNCSTAYDTYPRGAYAIRSQIPLMSCSRYNKPGCVHFSGNINGVHFLAP